MLYVIKKGGDNFFFWLWLLVFAFQLFLLTIFPTVIAPIFNKCVRLSVRPRSTPNQSRSYHV